LATPIISSILLNGGKVYDQENINLWERSFNAQNSPAESDFFGLRCELLLIKKNNFTINFKKNLRSNQNNNLYEFHSYFNILFYKITADQDREFYLRETLDKYKIRY
jgi:hypothetical protein